MKLTETRIKEIILEEIKILEQDDSGDKASYGISDLKKELIDLGNTITKVPGLQADELKLISGIIGFVVKIASEKSGGTNLKRVYQLLEKFDGQ